MSILDHGSPPAAPLETDRPAAARLRFGAGCFAREPTLLFLNADRIP
jgi:hypothetical protein